MDKEAYLADVQIGDKLYNFLEGNKEYVVAHICEEYEEIIVRPNSLPQEIKDPRFLEFSITVDGAIESNWDIPHFLYAPVDVLDPKNLPPRPWKPKRGEWVWGKDHDNYWDLVKYIGSENNKHYCMCQDGYQTTYKEITPFKGELPPGLEEEE